ncbi:GTP pyrophosphokinase family protein [Ligilactobacillus saerimneri]|uniref:GTP pyrophosphokinase n=1 Tax=Ligilactobacillus saerimneri TaxID=228229 RepID=UPI0030D1285A
MSIYGEYHTTLTTLLTEVQRRILAANQEMQQNGQPKLFEHLIGRVKTPASMEEKCLRKGYPVTTTSALRKCKDAVGIRIVCNFIDDIDRCLKYFKHASWCSIIQEKDYIKNAKPNGYRSYHIILDVVTPHVDIDGHTPGHYFIEVQLRTIAMDSWASLEHEMKYKHNIANPQRIEKELKRCADQLASCDVQMQTIRQLINAAD